MKRILITGADSYVGEMLKQYLKRWPNEYSVDTVDTKDVAWKSADFSQYESVFHVAGIAHADICKVSEEGKRLYYKVNTDLAIEVAEKAKKSGVKQFVFMSTANIYGGSSAIGKSKVITKSSPVCVVNIYSDSKRKAEEGLEELRDSDFKVVILRCPMIYGRACKGNYVTLSGMAKKLPFFPKIENARSMLYIGNLVEFVRLMIKNEEDGIFCPCDREWFCTTELVELIAKLHGKKMLLIPGMCWMLKLLSHVSGKVNKAFGSFSYSDEVSAYKEEYRVYTLEEAVRETEVF